MSISSSVVFEHRPPRSSSAIYIGTPRGDSEPSAPLVSPRTPGDKKDLVTFLEALSTVLQQNPWLRVEVINALDGANLPAGQTFSVRRHILGRRLHAYKKRLVPGDTVILKVARGYKAGRATIPDGSADHEISEQMDALIREVQVLTHRRVRDASEIIDLLHLLWEYDQDILRPVLVFEYANSGTLAAFVRSGRADNLEIKASLCRDVVKGLAVLHEVGVIHGDVKCENVVVFQQDDGSFVAKLIDFGFSKFLAELEPGAHIRIGGTEPFTPPEAISLIEREALIYTDYFCFGMLVWQVLLDGLHDEDLFYQEPFHCPLRAVSQSDWSTYIQNAKKEVTFINKVKASIRPKFSQSDKAYWAYFSCIFENTLSSVPTQRRIDRILAFTGDRYCEFNWNSSLSAALQPHPDHALLKLEYISTFPASLISQILSSLERISGIPEDRRAAEACFLLSQCHINGVGNEQSDEKGLYWLKKATSLGHQVAHLAQAQITGQDNTLFDPWNLITPLDPDAYPVNVSDTPETILQVLAENSNLTSDLTGSQDSIVHWAATFGLHQHLRLFLDVYPELLEAKNVVGETPLICAARHGNASCIIELFLRGANVDHASFAGETALHWLVSFPDEAVETMGTILFSRLSLFSYALVRNQAPNVVATGLKIVPGTPLSRAVTLGRQAVVTFFLQRGADCFFSGLNRFDVDALKKAGAADNYEMPDIHERELLPIHRACQNHDDQMLNLILGHQSIMLPGWAGKTAPPRGILAAIKADQDDGLGCSNYCSYSLLGYACDPISRFSRMCIHGPRQKEALQQTFELLLSNPGQALNRVTYTGQSAILTACLAGDSELVIHVLSLLGCQLTLEKSYIGGWGRKPLHIAAMRNDLIMCKALLDAGADILSETSSGQTAVLFCAAGYFLDHNVLRLLLSREPNLATMESYWDSPFSAAVRNHDFKCARLLLEYGADPNQLLGPRATSTTLFQILAADNDVDAVQFLLSIPEISFEVSARKRFTALHASAASRLRYNKNGEFQVAPGEIFEKLLVKWHSKKELEAHEIRGYTALHFACAARDIVVTKLLLKAMQRVGAEVNIMTYFFGSPVWKTPLDLIDDRSQVPCAVLKKGAQAIEQYNAKMNELRRMLVEAGGKNRATVLSDKWGSLSFAERTMASLLSNKYTRPFAVLGGLLYTVWMSGTDVFTNYLRFRTQSNPDEVYYRRH